jgi:hypothetical protein
MRLVLACSLFIAAIDCTRREPSPASIPCDEMLDWMVLRDLRNRPPALETEMRERSDQLFSRFKASGSTVIPDRCAAQLSAQEQACVRDATSMEAIASCRKRWRR